MPSLQRHGVVNVSKTRSLVVTWLAALALTNIATVQQANTALPDAPVANDKNGCVQPVPVLSVSDINGRFGKVEAFLTHKIELKTVHKPYSGKGPRICGLTASQEFDMFVQNGSEPLTFLTAGFNAAITQASDDESAFARLRNYVLREAGFNVVSTLQEHDAPKLSAANVGCCSCAIHWRRK
jgi:hypothetical protein